MLRRQDWAFFAEVGAIVQVVEAARWLDVQGMLVWGAAAVAAGALARRWSRLYPAPMPHSLRWILALPHPFHSPRALRRILAPRPGEHLLEIGPGTGFHALPVATWLVPGGMLDVLDVQQAMLDDLARRARRKGIPNIVAQQGSAEDLPYPDGLFDGAYLMSVLGEIPDPQAAARELRRVLKPGGRVVIGELIIDPDFISLSRLRALLEGAGFSSRGGAGPFFAYLARFVAP